MWQFLIEHWPWLASASGIALIRLLYRGAINLSLAAWERDQLKSQIGILEDKITRLEHLIDDPSESESSGDSSAGPASIPTRIRRRRPLSNRWIDSSIE